MKLIIQIPCYNESETLPIALKELPRHVDGFDKVEWLIIDDGSNDNTAEVAKQNGVDHIIQFKKNKGLAKGFLAGIDAALSLGADVIVNTDADNQYCAADIPKLVQPILNNEASYVIGSRPIMQTQHFSPIKKILQKLGSYVVRFVSGTQVPDAPSGFRAVNRRAAQKLNVFNNYTYTLETIIQAGMKNIAIGTVPIRTNAELRPSRLFKSIPAYIKKSIVTIFRIMIIYKPFRFFFTIGAALFTIGTLIGLRFLYFYFTDGGEGHIQSLILASITIGAGIQCSVIAFIADLLSVNRMLLEDMQFRIKQIQQDGPRHQNQ